MADVPTAQQLADLDVARSLAAAGVPLFVAAPDPNSSTGYALPRGWQRTAPDPAIVDAWRPGTALCAVMGAGLDLVDLDPRNGATAQTLDPAPRALAAAATPSGGVHLFIRSVGVGSRDGLLPGVDLKGGLPDGSSRGFAFIAPTVRVSKATGAPAGYAWTQAPDVAALTAGPDSAPDPGAVALATRVRQVRSESGVQQRGGPVFWQRFMAPEPQSAAAAERAIVEKLAGVTAWRPTDGAGFRHVLMRAALTLGGYVGGGYLDEADAWHRLEQAAAQVWGSADEDDRRWISQGLSDGSGQPFYVYTPEDELSYGAAAQAVAATRTAPTVAGEPWSPYRALGTEAFDPGWCCSDQEFAEAVAARTAPLLRFAADADTWLVRESDRWRERGDLSGWAVSMVARLMPLGETPVPRDLTERTPAHWAAARRATFMSSAGAGRIERKLRSIVRGGEHPVAVELGDLDGEAEVLWAGGQPWDLRASAQVPTLAPIDPATPHLRTAACVPDTRPTPAWDAFCAAVWPDPAVRAWALRVLAIAVTGYADAALPVLYGPERSGKTALVTLLVDLLGSYGHAADPRLLAGAEHTHASVVYALKGRRLSFIDEGPRRGHLATERLKQITGSGQLTGNAMRANPITFRPTHTLVMTTNDEPPITDPALRARMRLIPCDSPEQGVREARRALTPAVWALEAPGVLAMLMREAAAWLADPESATLRRAPAGLQGLVDDIARGQDPVRDWVTTATVPADPGTPSRELYGAFVRWISENPLYRRGTPPTETAFGRSLTEQGYAVHLHGPDRLRFRRLSVLSGPAGYAPWEPVPSPHMTRGEERVERVESGLRAGSDVQPAHPYNPSSGPVFEINRAGRAGSPPLSTERNTPLLHIEDTGEKTRGNTGSGTNPLTSELKTGPDQALERVSGLPGEPAHPVEDSSEAGGTQKTADHGLISPRSVSKSDTAARAYQGQDQKQISKAEARRLIAEEKRQAAITQAQGEVFALPAVVDRDQHVIPVTPDQAADVVRAAIGRAGALTVDVETSGYPVGHRHYVLRSVQLGDDLAAAVLDPADQAQAALITTLLLEAPRLHAHSASADLVPLDHAGLLDAAQGWARMYDTVIPAKLADPRSTGSDPGLKALSGAVLGSAAVAPEADAGRDAVFRAGKWLIGKQRFAQLLTTPVERNGWANIETGSTAMLRYAASDVLDTGALSRVLPPVDAPILARERLAQEMTARVAHRGLRIDAKRVAELTAEHQGKRDEAGAHVQAFGIDNPGSGQQVAAAIERLGVVLPRSEKDNPSVAEHVLSIITRSMPGTSAAELAAATLAYRHSATVLGLFLEPYRLLCEHADGRMRPTVYTLGTDTGRMCLPTDHGLVTPTGHVKAQDVREGMTTLDADGRWVRVLAVHRYADAPIETFRSRCLEIAGTPEHRWLTTREHEAVYAAKVGRPAPARELRPLGDHPRLRVHLAPEVEPFDPAVRTIPADTDAQRFAALVGMLVTDGRCAESDEPEVGMRAYVYQTEAKFHAEFVRVIPDDAVMFDRVTASGERHHEIRIAARWLRPRLEAAGLHAGAKLKESPDLHAWVAGLPLDEVRAFFAACWLSDGCASNRSISCGSANLRTVLTLAAYRLGLVVHETESPPSEWSTKPRIGLALREPVITTRRAMRGETRGDVWCVTTETGTFTAVGPRGTVYLTGNSCVRPNAQQLPRSGGVRSVVTADPGHVLISADFAGVELRGAAALSQDPSMIHMIAEEDAGRFDGFHWAVARQAFGPDATKADRYDAKRGVFCDFYGGSPATIAKQLGIPQESAEAISSSLKALAPGYQVWSSELRKGVRQGRTQFAAYSGRTIHFPAQFPHKAPNYAIQGSCRELLVDALVRWRQTRWGEATLLPVHDELIVAVPEADAEAATAELVGCMQGELYGVPIIAEPSAPSFAWQDAS